jgi:adenine deaminase
MMHSLGASYTSEAIQSAVPTENAKIRVIELLNQNITAERLGLDARKGYVEADFEQDLLKVAIFDRHDQIGRIAMGFLKGLGAKIGAVGTTADLDENTLLVAGSSDLDMAVCANTLIESGGGIAIVNNGVA